MFGMNKVTHKIRGPVDTFWIQEVFATIQGEGPFTGCASVFVRTGGCNLRCTFCDTDFESSRWRPTAEELYRAIYKAMDVNVRADNRLVVFTGGEPMLQPLGPVVERLLGMGWRVQYETAGTTWDESLSHAAHSDRFFIVCSPKTPNISPLVEHYCKDWKYIVRENDADDFDGLPTFSTQQAGMIARLYRPSPYGNTIWVQPCAEYIEEPAVTIGEKPVYNLDEAKSSRNEKHAIALSMKYGYRLSMQLHKMIGMP